MADELLEIADDGTNDYVERLNKDGEITRVVPSSDVSGPALLS
jgi:hypothetical protein